MLLITYGTRPEYLKIKPIVNQLYNNGYRDNYFVLFTGQHKNIAPSDIADGILECDYIISNNRLDHIIGNIIKSLDDFFIINEEIKFTHVLVQGDTTSCLAISLATFHRKLKLIHLEAGLRTFNIDNPFPEEANRQLISKLASLHLCPTKLSKQNLVNENIRTDKYVVGNTALDNLIDYKKNITYQNKILITLHRRENHEIIDEWFNEINDLAKKHSNYRFIIPLHPNPEVHKHRDLLTNVEIVEPMNHTDLLQEIQSVKLVITDSGGIQEECSFLNKKCLVCRKTTERPEALNKTSFLIKKPERLKKSFNYHIHRYDTILNNKTSPFGDGQSSKKIINIFKKKNII